MKVLQINTVCGTGSTGRIATDLYKILIEQGHECKIAYGRGNAHNISEKDVIHIGNVFDVYIHAFLTRITDKTGFYSQKATKKLIKEIDEYNPDIVHLHNIHGYYINIEILFKYLSNTKKTVIWTLHDCWAFTGHCTHFDYIGCYKWKEKCSKDCPQKCEYPKSILFDNCEWNFLNKKQLFTSIDNMTIITPSKWLSNLVSNSFLSEYQVNVIPNGIDLSVFKPVQSNFRKLYGLEDKFVILGVSNIWDYRKGLKDFIKLSKQLDESYRIVLVGLTKKQIKKLPLNILGIEKTNNVHELVEIYSTADVFVNPTLEDNFPTVNLEALACGTPVITYNTGGSIESIDETSGIIVDKGDLKGLMHSVKQLSKHMLIKKDVLDRAISFNKIDKFKEYIRLYEYTQNNIR